VPKIKEVPKVEVGGEEQRTNRRQKAVCSRQEKVKRSKLKVIKIEGFGD